jgi:long-chain acyl-CoA synthetase
VVLSHDLTEDSGHLTPKLTIKRHVIMKDFADDVERIYQAAPATEGQSLTL